MPMAYEPAGPGTYDMGVCVLYDGLGLDTVLPMELVDLVRLDLDIFDSLDACLLCW
jgi:hypothetical protein